ncbi:signal transduction histidine kinase [Methylopila capsulata]|uniref:histidine kinase n=1 Tax=Methylopila capsulata TaxID=61654 RepID=A0A9W6MQR1_9HYPH|nr:HAMP domain-containing sensor histidine kinase [Methylopila capsulata]MBM7851420.1 signal transduction histidine kinase [Methylopila capsulata]GLK54477.1 two-component sensor histidine kinase [Methylopila capsulata]
MNRWRSLFLCGSIRRQIIILTALPILAVVVIASLIYSSENKTPYKSRVAIKIQMVVSQLAVSGSPQAADAVMTATSQTGLKVERLSARTAAAELVPFKTSDCDLAEISGELTSSLGAEVRKRTIAGSSEEVIAVPLAGGDVLAFTPAVRPSLPLLHPERLLFLPKVLVVVLPMLLLAIYVGSIITAPLTNFARAAQALSPDEGPDRPFEEHGPKEISALARALNDMRARIREMIDGRTRMVRAISHDLRTPLTRIRMRAERSTDPALRDAMLTDISRIDAMIQETLNYLQRDVASEAAVRVDLPSLLQTVCHDFANLDLPVSYEGPPRLAFACKPQALVRAFTNLVDNGVKFAGLVTVRLETLADGGVRVEVADDGPGIPQELRAKVVEPFFKGDASRAATAPGGFGLGLSIVDEIVRNHGGTMTLLASDPHGLVVRVDLPALVEASIAQSGDARSPMPYRTEQPRHAPI